MPHARNALSAKEIDHFLTKGHVVIKNCFDRAFAADWIDLAYQRLGYRADEPATWTEPRVHLPSMNRVPIRELAPKAWAAICALTGGAERIAGEAPAWGDSFICNFNLRADEPWQPPSAQVPGWHKDGDWFVHYLNGPEQGLLTIVVWSDIQPRSGGTFVEITGETGDVVLLHPFVLHAASQNPSGRPRFITNPSISLKEPMNFNRADSAEFSPIESAVLQGLELDRLDYRITGERRRLTPEREKRQQKMLKEQRKRLEATDARA